MFQILFKKVIELNQLVFYYLVKLLTNYNLDHHELIVSNATYAPWKQDPIFIKIFNTIEHYTLIDKMRLYEVWSLVEECSKLPGGDFIEVGAWRGGSSTLIAKAISTFKINSKLYICDTFSGVVKATDSDSFYKGGEHADTSRETVQNLLSSLNLEKNTEILKGIFPEETGTMITSKSFRFCHIDVDVYQSTKDIVDWIWPKLVIGGIILIDDFGFIGCDGVTNYINKLKADPDKIIIHNLNGHAILIKR